MELNYILELYEKTVELLIGIAWPIVFIAIVLILKTSIVKAIKAITESLASRRITIDKGKLAFEPPEQNLPKDEDIFSIDIADPKLQSFFNDRLDNARLNAEKAIAELTKEKPSWSREDVLLNAFADLDAALILERIYSSMFGSQIDLINSLSKNNNEAKIDVAKSIYDKATTDWPTMYPDYSYEDWLNYLVASGVILINDDQIKLTNVGTAFKPYFKSRNIIPTRAY